MTTTATQNEEEARYEALKDVTDVVGYIRDENEKQKAQAPENTLLFLTAPEIGARYDSAYEYEKEMALQTYSDCYKSSRGIRPSLDRSKTISEILDDIEAL